MTPQTLSKRLKMTPEEADFDEILYDRYSGPGLWTYLQRFHLTVEDVVTGDVSSERRNKRKGAKKGRSTAKGDYQTLNGRRVRKEDVQWINKLNRRTLPTVTLKKIDQICTYYDLQLWEALDAADPVANSLYAKRID